MTTESGEVTMVCWHLLRVKLKATVHEEEWRGGLREAHRQAVVRENVNGPTEVVYGELIQGEIIIRNALLSWRHSNFSSFISHSTAPSVSI